MYKSIKIYTTTKCQVSVYRTTGPLVIENCRKLSWNYEMPTFLFYWFKSGSGCIFSTSFNKLWLWRIYSVIWNRLCLINVRSTMRNGRINPGQNDVTSPRPKLSRKEWKRLPLHVKNDVSSSIAHEKMTFLLQILSFYYLSHIMRKPVFAVCQQQRCRSACAFRQSDQHLCYLLLR